MATSRSLNKVILIGNLSRDPEVRYTQNGALVCTFGLATNTTWLDSNGQQKESTEWHNIVAWNKLGEICSNILSKGMLVYIEGELRTRVWGDDEDKRYRTEIKLNDMKLLDSKGKSGVGLEASIQSGQSEPGSTEGNSSSEGVEESEEVGKDSNEISEDEVKEEDLPF